MGDLNVYVSTGCRGCKRALELVSWLQEARPSFDVEVVDVSTTERPDQGSVFAERKGTSSYRPAVLTYTDAAGEQVRLELKVRTRGRYRRQRGTCSFPPLRLNFVTKQAKRTVFAKQDKLKLVTHCRYP